VSSAEREARRILIRGRVQGVAFRWSARTQAEALGVCGWIRNLADGRVDAHVEGGAQPVDAMLQWLKEGPPAARVEAIEVRSVPPAMESGFVVRR
jgi:acylphosphatase